MAPAVDEVIAAVVALLEGVMIPVDVVVVVVVVDDDDDDDDDDEMMVGAVRGAGLWKVDMAFKLPTVFILFFYLGLFKSVFVLCGCLLLLLLYLLLNEAV